jgi:hypothetical protein
MAPFSFTVRRNYCRYCGNVYCNPCVSKQASFRGSALARNFDFWRFWFLGAVCCLRGFSAVVAGAVAVCRLGRQLASARHRPQPQLTVCSLFNHFLIIIDAQFVCSFFRLQCTLPPQYGVHSRVRVCDMCR